VFFAIEGVSFGIADGVGGWVESGVDPALFSQALMYHAHRYSRNAWAGEPEIDPTLDYEEREEIEGWEMTPYECLDLAYGGVLREKFVQAGERLWCPASRLPPSSRLRVEYGLPHHDERIFRSAPLCKVSLRLHFPISLAFMPQCVVWETAGS
jgi:protein phosphatase PTC7